MRESTRRTAYSASDIEDEITPTEAGILSYQPCFPSTANMNLIEEEQIIGRQILEIPAGSGKRRLYPLTKVGDIVVTLDFAASWYHRSTPFIHHDSSNYDILMTVTSPSRINLQTGGGYELDKWRSLNDFRRIF